MLWRREVTGENLAPLQIPTLLVGYNSCRVVQDIPSVGRGRGVQHVGLMAFRFMAFAEKPGLELGS